MHFMDNIIEVNKGPPPKLKLQRYIIEKTAWNEQRIMTRQTILDQAINNILKNSRH